MVPGCGRHWGTLTIQARSLSLQNENGLSRGLPTFHPTLTSASPKVKCSRGPCLPHLHPSPPVGNYTRGRTLPAIGGNKRLEARFVNMKNPPTARRELEMW